MRFRCQICVRDATYPTSPIHPSNIPNVLSNSASSMVSGGSVEGASAWAILGIISSIMLPPIPARSLSSVPLSPTLTTGHHNHYNMVRRSPNQPRGLDLQARAKRIFAPRKLVASL